MKLLKEHPSFESIFEQINSLLLKRTQKRQTEQLQMLPRTFKKVSIDVPGTRKRGIYRARRWANHLEGYLAIVG